VVATVSCGASWGPGDFVSPTTIADGWLHGRTSGLSTLNKDWIPERGARIARRDDREYREYLREEQRREAGCPRPEAGP
jgi:hypothetical protein